MFRLLKAMNKTTNKLFSDKFQAVLKAGCFFVPNSNRKLRPDN